MNTFTKSIFLLGTLTLSNQLKAADLYCTGDYKIVVETKTITRPAFQKKVPFKTLADGTQTAQFIYDGPNLLSATGERWMGNNNTMGIYISDRKNKAVLAYVKINLPPDNNAGANLLANVSSLKIPLPEGTAKYLEVSCSVMK